MIAGRIDEFGRTLVTLVLRPADDAVPTELEVWVDTEFTGDLVLPKTLVQRLQLPQSAMVATVLADGTEGVMETYTSLVEWCGESQQVEVIAGHGRTPLLGVGMLLGHRLIADYIRQELTIE